MLCVVGVSHLCMMAEEILASTTEFLFNFHNFTAWLPEARHFNLTIIRSAQQIGFSARGEMFDFYYNTWRLSL